MINGIEPNPTVVGNHVDTIAGTTIGLRRTANRDAFTIILIVAPGIITDAKDCQTNTSTNDVAAFSVGDTDAADPSVDGVAGDDVLMYVLYPVLVASAKQYPNDTI